VNATKWVLLVINVLGGAAVLGSYILGLRSHPNGADTLWGGVPQAIRPFYGIWMFVAAAGYFAFTLFLLFAVDANVARVAQKLDITVFNILYAAILVPSALWMPLTFAFAGNPSAGLWLAVRLALWIVGLASLAFIIALLALQPREPAWAYWLAVAGSVAFTIQTGLLDAIVWVTYFRS